MSMRVSTFSQTSTVLQNALTTQAKLAAKQEQESTGLISTDYAGLGSDASKVVNLEVSLARSETTLSLAESALTRVETMYSALATMSDILTTMRSEVSANSTSDDTSTLQITAAEMLEELAATINTQFEGRYLFAGGETLDAPVSLDAYEAVDLDTEDTSYYLGDDKIQSVRLTSTRSLNYGITGDNSALELAIRTLSYLATADPLDSEDLNQVSEQLVEAQDQIIALQSAAGFSASTLETVISTEESYIATAEELVTDLTSVDIAAAAVEAANYVTQLEASYAALGTLTDLSLLDYLR